MRVEPLPRAASAQTPPVRRTVLYVEDSAANARLVEEVLAQRAGIAVRSAADGRAGVAAASAHLPDAILLDLNLPDMPGEEVFQRLQSDPRTRGIPVVVTSADVSPARLIDMYALGASAMIPKPFDLDRLVGAIADAVAGPGDHARADAPSPRDDPSGVDVLDRVVVSSLRELAGTSAEEGWFENLVRMFLEDAETHLQGLRLAYEHGDAPEVASAAHALTGTSANLGARLLARHSSDLEARARSGDLAGASEVIERLTVVWAETGEALRREVARRHADPT